MEEINNKQKVIEDFSDVLKNSKGLIFTDYSGLKFESLTELRKQLKQLKSKYKIVKNTYTDLSLKKLGKDAGHVENLLDGPTALVLIDGEPLPVIKKLYDFFVTNKKPLIKSAYVWDKWFDNKQVASLAKLPTREQLLAQTAGCLKLLLVRLVFSVKGPMNNLVYALDQVSKKNKTITETEKE